MDGPEDKQTESSNSSDFSLPPHPTQHNVDRSPPKWPPGYNPPPPIDETVVRQNTKHIQFQNQAVKQESPPKRPPGSSPPPTGASAAVVPTTTQFQVIEAHPVSQAGPVIGPYVQRTETLATRTQPVTCVPQPRETLSSWQATSEEMAHVIPTTTTTGSTSVSHSQANLEQMSRSQPVVTHHTATNRAHSAGLHIPHVPMRSGSSLSAPGELFESAVSVNPQVSLSGLTNQTQKTVQQDTRELHYKTDQRKKISASTANHVSQDIEHDIRIKTNTCEICPF